MHVAQRWVGAALWCLMMIGPITKKAAQSSFLVGWLVHYSWNYAKGSSEGSLSLIEDPSRGPQAHFFDPPLRDQNRGNARQQNAIGMPRGGCNRWPLIISNYILFYIACNLRGRFSLLKLKTPQRWRRRMKVIIALRASWFSGLLKDYDSREQNMRHILWFKSKEVNYTHLSLIQINFLVISCNFSILRI